MKPFADKGKQITILKSRNLSFTDVQQAKKLLMRFGYYEIVNGYKTFLLDTTASNETFKEGATFEQLFSLYELDKDIRNGVLRATLEVELSLRNAIAYTLAEDFGVNEKDYLFYKNFRQGDSIWFNSQATNERAILLNKLTEISRKNIEPLNHYRSTHGHIPPWILLKESTFGNLKHIFKLLKGKQKDKVISICYGIGVSEITNDLKSLFKDSLSVINSFRNRAAHSGRILNFKSNLHKLKFNNYFHPKFGFSAASYRQGSGMSDIYTLLKILQLFDNHAAKINLEFSISYSVYEHCKIYPNDLPLLAQEMNYSLKELMNNLKHHES